MSLVININGFDVDYGESRDLRAKFNYSIADINNVGGKSTQGSRSYNIKLPATATNKQIFGYTEDITVTNGFDHTVEFPCYVDVDGSRIIEGNARIKAAFNNKTLDSYTIIILGDNATWIQAFRDKSVLDVDFSDQEHIYNKATIDASEMISDIRQYVYPVINYGGFGITQSNIDVKVTDRYPAIRAVEILKRMYAAEGYTVESAFLDSDFFTRLFIPFTGKDSDEILPSSFRDDRLFRANFEGPENDVVTISGGVNYIIPFNNDSTGEYFDNGGLYDTSTGIYSVDAYSSQNIVFNFDYSVLRTLIVQTKEKLTGIILNTKTLASGESFNFNASTFIIEANTGNGWFTHTTASGVTPADSISTGFINVKPGDKFRCRVKTIPDKKIVKTIDGLIVLVVTSVEKYRTVVKKDGESTLFYNNVKRSYSKGSTVDLSSYLQDINQLDYFTDIRDAFNLYALTDVNRRIVYIEPEDDFFRDEALDWSDKINQDKPKEVSFMGDNLSNVLNIKYLDDSSDANLKKFKDDNERSFGSQAVDILNVSAKAGESDKSLKVFAPTMIKTIEGIGLINTTLPTMINDLLEPELKTSFKTRLLLYRGVKNNKNGDIWTFEGESRVTHPRMTFVDDDNSATNILSYNQEGRRGLFDTYFRNKYNTINNSRLYGVEVNLSAADIEAFDFRNPIFIDEEGEVTYYNVNKISNYDPISRAFTKVQLIKSINPVPQAEETFVVAQQPPQNIPQAPSQFPLLATIGNTSTVAKFTNSQGKTEAVKFN